MSPWYRREGGDEVGFLVARMVAGHSAVDVEWASSGGRRPHLLARRRVRLRDETAMAAVSPWMLVTDRELGRKPPAASLVRLKVADLDDDPAAWIAVSAPIAYRETALGALVGSPGATTLVHPQLNLFFPCVQLPRLADGRAQVPDYLMLNDTASLPLGEADSPFGGLASIGRPVELPPERAGEPLRRIRFYWLDGAARPGEGTAPVSVSLRRVQT